MVSNDSKIVELTKIIQENHFDSKMMNVKIYFIRDTRSDRENERFELKTIDIREVIPVELKDIISKKLNFIIDDLQDGKRIVKDFYDEDYTINDISMIPNATEDIPSLNEILSKMSLQLDTIKDMSKLKGFETYAVEFNFFENDNDRIVYFRKITRAILLSSNTFTKFFIKGGRLDSLETDIFAVDKNIDCVYFQKQNVLVIINKPLAEQIFNFTAYYVKYTNQAFISIRKLGFIQLDSRLTSNLLENTPLIKRITKLHFNKMFNIKLEDFIIAHNHIKENPKNYESTKFNLHIKDENLIIIDNQVRFESFLYLCDYGVMEDIIRKKPYLITNKEPLK